MTPTPIHITLDQLISRDYSLIPTQPNKKPFFKWEPYQTTKPSRAQLVTWQKEHNPSGWAVVTGSVSGIITLDFDGEPGVKSMERLGLRAHRITPSNGRHVDFEHPGWKVPTLNGKSKQELGKQWPSLDIRGDGGYAICFGKTDKGQYQWLRDPDPEPLSILPEPLRAFLGLLHPPKQKSQPDPIPISSNRNHSLGRLDPELLIQKALAEISRNGGRNNSGFCLAQQLRDNGYSESETKSFALAYRSRCPDTNSKGQVEPYTEHECLASVKKTFEMPARQPWGQQRNQYSVTRGATALAPEPLEDVFRETPPSSLYERNTEVHAGRTTAQPEGDRDWRARLITDKKGFPKACLANAITALTFAPEWAGVLAYDEFSFNVVSISPLPWKALDGVMEWGAQDDRLLTDWLQHQGILLGLEIVGQAVETVARKQARHPLREYLDALTWDGVERLNYWLQFYLGAEDSIFCRAVASKFCLSAIARAYQPGVKADCVLILEGAQGIRKSTAIESLFGTRFFTDDISDLGSKDAALQVAGVWVVELGELDSMNKVETGRIKAFVSRKIDRFRPPYGKRTISAPRSCVFVGTVNHDTYLKDETGARRFWPIRCHTINHEQLALDRDQLWAEAISRYHAGETWWLDTDEQHEQAEEAQADRYEGDPWGELIKPWIEGRNSVKTTEILQSCLNKPHDQWSHSDKIRISRILTAAKWERYKHELEPNVDGKRMFEPRYRPR